MAADHQCTCHGTYNPDTDSADMELTPGCPEHDPPCEHGKRWPNCIPCWPLPACDGRGDDCPLHGLPF